MARSRWRNEVLPFLVLTLLTSVPLRAEDPPKEPGRESGKVTREVKRAGKELLQDAKAVGRDVQDSKAARYVEEGARDLGRDAADVSREGWDKSKSLSGSAADEVKRATREFWDDVIRTKQAVVEKLRKENSDLKAKKGEEAARSEPAKEVR